MPGKNRPSKVLPLNICVSSFFNSLPKIETRSHQAPRSNLPTQKTQVRKGCGKKNTKILPHTISKVQTVGKACQTQFLQQEKRKALNYEKLVVSFLLL